MGNEEPKLTPPENGEIREELTIDQLPAKFEFVVPPKLEEEVSQLRKLLVEVLSTTNHPDVLSLLNQHQDLREKIIETTPKDNKTLPIQGANLELALIKRDAANQAAASGNTERERELLYDYKDILNDVYDLEVSLVDVLEIMDAGTFSIIDKEIDRVFQLVGRRPKTE